MRDWLAERTGIRLAGGGVPQRVIVVRDESDRPVQALVGSLALSTEGRGLTPGKPLSLIQASETPEEALLLSQWFDGQWASLPNDPRREVRGPRSA